MHRIGRCDFVVYDCSFRSFRSGNRVEFAKRLFEAHSYETNFRYKCGISSCTRVFIAGSSFDTFRGHCARKHHSWQVDFTPSLEPLREEASYVSSGCTANREVSETDSMVDNGDDVDSSDDMDMEDTEDYVESSDNMGMVDIVDNGAVTP